MVLVSGERVPRQTTRSRPQDEYRVMPPILANGLAFSVHGNLGGFAVTHDVTVLEPGLEVLNLRFRAGVPEAAPQVAVCWTLPIRDVQARWTTDADRQLWANWWHGLRSKVTSQAPVFGLYNSAGENRLTFAASDALNNLELKAGVSEETGEFDCEVKLFDGPTAPIAAYDLQVRLDLRPLLFHQVLKQVAAWWAAMPGYEPAPVPEPARLPIYSTWYSFHQVVEPARVLEQCRLAKRIGCEAVIVDDGWETLDSGRYFAYVGEWKPERIPDMAGFVRQVHAEQMKCLIWYAVPMIGMNSPAHARFAGKYLRDDSFLKASILDVRFPEARDYLVTIYENAVRDWDLDGLKLDFVDSIEPTIESARQLGGGRDYDSVPQAADRLLTDVMRRLRVIRPEIMIEFRQGYIGPLMRKYGNLFRAGDCPADSVNNRQRTIDLRLLAGNTAVHADMLMWHPDEPVEAAALQYLAVLFAVPQISVLLDKIPVAHQEMLKFWNRFWLENRDVLLDGDLEPFGIRSNYPVVRSSTASKRVLAVYEENAVAAVGGTVPATLYLVNATHQNRVVLALAEALTGRLLELYDCRGVRVASETVEWPAGVREVTMPPSGLAVVRNEKMPQSIA